MDLRTCQIRQLREKSFDVAIVGGGINGAVSAAALSAKGYRVALIEKGDFASATSQESSNLIWGGIKYLESGELELVYKLCRSRNTLIKSYPSMVREIRFFTALAPGFRLPLMFLYLGTWLYWLIGKFATRIPTFLSKKKILTEMPMIKEEVVKGGVEYSDAYLIDNDARFVFDFIRKAMDHGASCVSYMRVHHLARDEKGIWTLQCQDQINQEDLVARARVLVNAAGPYVDLLNQQSGMETRCHHVFSKGVHLIVPQITSQEKVLTFFADDGRMFFVIPMQGRSCIGTTDTRVSTLPAVVTDEDRQFILENINKRLNLSPPLTSDSILSERCGVRPLVIKGKMGSEDQKDWTSLSRKHEIEVDQPRTYLSIFGGKLTDCLNIGEEVVKAVESMGLPLLFPEAPWYGEPPLEVKERFLHQANLANIDSRFPSDLGIPLSQRLWRTYGQNAFEILDLLRQNTSMQEVLFPAMAMTRAEVTMISQKECVQEWDDFLRRRTLLSLLYRKEELKEHPGIRAIGDILFRERSKEAFQTYFDSPCP